MFYNIWNVTKMCCQKPVSGCFCPISHTFSGFFIIFRFWNESSFSCLNKAIKPQTWDFVRSVKMSSKSCLDLLNMCIKVQSSFDLQYSFEPKINALSENKLKHFVVFVFKILVKFYYIITSYTKFIICSTDLLTLI